VTDRVLVVEDHLLLAQLLVAALRERGLDAAVAPSTGPEDVLGATGPGVLVLLDLHLGDGRDGSRLVGALRAAGARVLVLTGSHDMLAVARALDEGAIDVLDKTRPFDELVDAVTSALAGPEPHDPASHYRIVQAARGRSARRAAAQEVLGRLTRREREVLDSLVRGAAAEEIALESVVSLATVRSQIRGVLDKLGVHSQLAAVARARALLDDVGETGVARD